MIKDFVQGKKDKELNEEQVGTRGEKKLKLEMKKVNGLIQQI